MAKSARIVDIATDYVYGLVGAVVVGGAAYAFGEYVLRLLAIGEIGAAIASVAAIALLCLGVVVGGGEPIYRRGLRAGVPFGPDARKQIWKGAFIGAPTVIALLSIAEMDWMAILSASRFLLPLRILAFIAVPIVLVATAPVRLLVYTLEIPAEAVMILAAPIGAVVMRRFAALETEATDAPPAKRSRNEVANDKTASAD